MVRTGRFQFFVILTASTFSLFLAIRSFADSDHSGDNQPMPSSQSQSQAAPSSPEVPGEYVSCTPDGKERGVLTELDAYHIHYLKVYQDGNRLGFAGRKDSRAKCLPIFTDKDAKPLGPILDQKENCSAPGSSSTSVQGWMQGKIGKEAFAQFTAYTREDVGQDESPLKRNIQWFPSPCKQKLSFVMVLPMEQREPPVVKLMTFEANQKKEANLISDLRVPLDCDKRVESQSSSDSGSGTEKAPTKPPPAPTPVQAPPGPKAKPPVVQVPQSLKPPVVQVPQSLKPPVVQAPQSLKPPVVQAPQSPEAGPVQPPPSPQPTPVAVPPTCVGVPGGPGDPFGVTPGWALVLPQTQEQVNRGACSVRPHGG